MGAILLAACYGGPGMYRPGTAPASTSDPVRLDRDGDGTPGAYGCADAADETCRDKLQLTAPPPAAELDCADDDPARHPGAEDAAGDGIDQNCDGADGWADPATGAR